VVVRRSVVVVGGSLGDGAGEADVTGSVGAVVVVVTLDRVIGSAGVIRSAVVVTLRS
jgi:hypothetical protein